MIVSRRLYWVLLAAAYIRMRPIIEYTKLSGVKVNKALFAASYIPMRPILESGLQLEKYVKTAGNMVVS